MKDQHKGCLALLSIPPLLVASVALHAWAFQQLWAWFVVPLGVPPVTRVHAYGLCSLVWMLTAHGASQKKSDDEGLGAIWIRLAMLCLGRPLLAIGVVGLVRWVTS